MLAYVQNRARAFFARANADLNFCVILALYISRA